jgi:hypothetical protein
MRRREFIVLFGSVASAWPLWAQAQPSVPVIGFLGTASPIGYAAFLASFLNGLKEAGFVEGSNVTIDYRWARDAAAARA